MSMQLINIEELMELVRFNEVSKSIFEVHILCFCHFVWIILFLFFLIEKNWSSIWTHVDVDVRILLHACMYTYTYTSTFHSKKLLHLHEAFLQSWYCIVSQNRGNFFELRLTLQTLCAFFESSACFHPFLIREKTGTQNRTWARRTAPPCIYMTCTALAASPKFKLEVGASQRYQRNRLKKSVTQR